jgi:hypothetical protein
LLSLPEVAELEAARAVYSRAFSRLSERGCGVDDSCELEDSDIFIVLLINIIDFLLSIFHFLLFFIKSKICGYS